ncbi:MAG: radical SAM protein [Archaeoglobaceae archaeon]
MFEAFVRRLRYPKHCEFCEGIDESVENPKHHPSYELTPKCNLRCAFCYSRVALEKGTAPQPGYYGDWNPKAITISQFGEPFLAGSGELARVIDELRRIFGDVRIDIQTNGTYDVSVLEGRADIVMISLSATRSYAKLTGVNALGSVLENIKRASTFAYTSVRAIYMPGINDEELREVAEIASEVDELFFQPLSIYRKNLPLLKGLDLERAGNLYEFLKKAYELSEIAEVRVPGCLLLNLRNFLKEHDLELLRFVNLSFGNVPLIRRERLFTL